MNMDLQQLASDACAGADPSVDGTEFSDEEKVEKVTSKLWNNT